MHSVFLTYCFYCFKLQFVDLHISFRIKGCLKK
nr:MAG TPA: Testis-expressed protein 19 [Inoviridae sp.]